VSDACCGGTCAPAPRTTGSAPAPPSAPAAERTWPIFVAGALIGASSLVSWMDASAVLALVGYLAAIALTISRPARRALAAMGARRLDINVLMVIAVAGAGALGEWLEAASVVWLFGIAQWLEGRSLDRARHAIRALMTLAPAQAIVRRDGREAVVATDSIAVGETVIVRPGERIPIDGVVRAGESDVDQSPVTGESRPIEKIAGAIVFSGSINGTGALDIEATRPAADSTLARIVRLVGEAQRRRAPVQSFVDRFALRYTPSVVALAIFVAFVPPLLVGGTAGWTSEFTTWSYRALALLVVACPCALVISTPVSIVSALTAAARNGVLIKGGAHLEQLARVRCVAFDKTGTLTDSRVRVTNVRPTAGASTQGVLAVAASLESRSEHPIGRAIVAHAIGQGLAFTPGERFRALPGFGAEAVVMASPAVVGNHRLFEERQLCTPDLHAHVEDVEERGGTPVLVSHGGTALGVLTLHDHLRDAGSEAISALRRDGIERVVMLTGDGPANAERVRANLGLDEAHAELLPEDKVDTVLRLRRSHGAVAMVGDGVNDAPALAAADVGVAMGAAGTDVALETADVALMSDDLKKLPYAFRLGRATLNNIHLNVGIALGLKIAFVAFAVSGVATLWMAVLADTGASLLVTANSLRLLRVR
jgi:Cd2+/Zn2+-exporting ATPase